MDPRKFLDLARDLHEKHTEAAYRSAISRAYYAAFHKSSAIFRSMGLTIRPDAIAHKDVYSYLLNSGASHMASAGSMLDNLREARNHADYRLHDKDISKDSRVQIEIGNAEKIIRKLDSKLSEPQQRKIKTTLLAYIKMRGGK